MFDRAGKFGPDSGIETDQSEDLSSPDDNKSDMQRDFAKYEDPLSEPIVRISLQNVKISPTQLISMSVKELNRKLVDSPSFVVSKLKRCRRTLKNRGYAKNCRIKRIAAKTHLEQVNMKLMLENRELRQSNKLLREQVNQFRENQMTAVYESTGGSTEVTSGAGAQPLGIYANNQIYHDSTIPQCCGRPDISCNQMTTCAPGAHGIYDRPFVDPGDLDNLVCEAGGFYQYGCSQQAAS